MTARRMTAADVEAFAEQLRATLAALDADDLSASAGMRHRLEGALAAVEVVLGQRSSLTDE